MQQPVHDRCYRHRCERPTHLQRLWPHHHRCGCARGQRAHHHHGNTYTTTSGTSFATPLTAGVLALMYSAPCIGLAQLARTNPQGAADAMRTALFAGVEQVGNLPGQTVTGGHINANNSVQYVVNNCATYSPAATWT
ncbi:MAG: S8 family serine peptidase [Flavobacteriales bacterium]|nr:S8 family serine peptidase [Flavobacteriales bacterium]